jgi:hypothetical protein
LLRCKLQQLLCSGPCTQLCGNMELMQSPQPALPTSGVAFRLRC